MPLIVENGRCPQFANSYVSLADADAYLAARGLWPETPMVEPDEIPIEPEEPPTDEENEGALPADASDSETDAKEKEPDKSVITAKEAALIRAFDFLNTLKWKGDKPCWERTTAWPRENAPIPGLIPVEYIEPDCVPGAVVQAQCELAALIYGGYGIFAPMERGGAIKSVSDSSTETVDVLSESKSHSVTYADKAPLGLSPDSSVSGRSPGRGEKRFCRERNTKELT